MCSSKWKMCYTYFQPPSEEMCRNEPIHFVLHTVKHSQQSHTKWRVTDISCSLVNIHNNLWSQLCHFCLQVKKDQNNVHQYPEIVVWIIWPVIIIDTTVSTVAFLRQSASKFWINMSHEQPSIVHCLHHSRSDIMTITVWNNSYLLLSLMNCHI